MHHVTVLKGKHITLVYTEFDRPEHEMKELNCGVVSLGERKWTNRQGQSKADSLIFFHISYST